MLTEMSKDKEAQQENMPFFVILIFPFTSGETSVESSCGIPEVPSLPLFSLIPQVLYVGYLNGVGQRSRRCGCALIDDIVDIFSNEVSMVLQKNVTVLR